MIIAKINRFFAKHGKIAVAALVGLMIVPLVFLYGAEGCRDIAGGRSGAVATIAGESVSYPEFQRQQRVIGFLTGSRSQGSEEVAEQVINRIMLLRRAEELGVDRVSPEELKARIMAIPDFQTEGKFDGAKYGRFEKENLRPRGYTVQFFEGVVHDNIVVGRVQDSLAVGVTMNDLESFVNFQHNGIQSSGQVARFSASKYRAEVKVTDEDVAVWYKENPEKYEIKELKKVKVVHFSGTALAMESNATEEELLAFYEDVWSKQVRASHILKKYKPGASDADKAKVREVAEALLAEARGGADFAELAKKNSEDVGSAKKGGDLNWFGRGRMVKEFEAAAYSLKDGEISDLVETTYGLHIIRKDGTRKSPVEFKTARRQVELMLKQSTDEARSREIWEVDPKYAVAQTRASQILLSVKLTDSDTVKDEQKKKADELLEKLKKDASLFGSLARATSNDTATSKKSGDMGWFAKGAKDPAIDKALDSMKEGELQVVESAVGFHVLKKTGAREKVPYAEARGAISAQLRNERNQKGREVAEKKANELLTMIGQARSEGESEDTVLAIFERVAEEKGYKTHDSDWFSEVDNRVAGIPGSTFALKRDALALTEESPLSAVVSAGNDRYLACFVERKDGYLPEVFEEKSAGTSTAKSPAKKRLSAAGIRAKNDLTSDRSLKLAIEAAKKAHEGVAAALKEGKTFEDAKGDVDFQDTGDFSPRFGPRGGNGREIADAAKEMKVGDLSDVIEATNGAVLFYLAGTTLPNVSEFSDRAASYRSFFLNRKQSAAANAAFKKMREDADVRYSGALDFMNDVEEETPAPGDAG